VKNVLFALLENNKKHHPNKIHVKVGIMFYQLEGI